ncbi:hypothetical protein [Polynucleobacter sp.]|jgi:hypothetical protein|uniref:SDH family Clp fold serine proteinase n=1 Tax=Polynucleobacter sp. TaxID=2029855 RepID=UPI00258B5605|nr:hypothetical protein [Polynucleobacter sp.]MCX7237287.1 hypothetical protein [Polynucleobacter sp.]
MTTDIIKYSGPIDLNGYQQISNILKNKQSPEALLILATSGGDPHAGFRIARALQHEYGQFKILIPRYCKSAGTLIAVGASELFLDDMSELGPLDIQVKKGDEIMGRSSGLDIIQAVNYLQGQAMSAFRTYLVELTRDAGLSTKVASDIASNLTTGLFEPIFGQIDPTKLAEMQRAMEIAFAYGARLNDKSQNLRQGGLEKLITSYPSHGFVIDRKEAKTIFTRVFKPHGALAQLSLASFNEMNATINSPTPVVNMICVNVSINGANNENASAPSPDSKGTKSAERAVNENCPPAPGSASLSSPSKRNPKKRAKP